MRFSRRALLLSLTSCVVLRPRLCWAEEFVLIRNAACSVTTVSRDFLFKLYTGQEMLFGGAVAQTVIGQEKSPELEWLASLFDMRGKDLFTRIKQEVFRGEMRRPIVAKTPAEAIAAVQGNSGGLAAVAASAVKPPPAGIALLGMH